MEHCARKHWKHLSIHPTIAMMNIETITIIVSEWMNSHYQKSYLKLKYSLIVTPFHMLYASKIIVSSELLIIINMLL